jgi:hypothetical protein
MSQYFRFKLSHGSFAKKAEATSLDYRKTYCFCFATHGVLDQPPDFSSAKLQRNTHF